MKKILVIGSFMIDLVAKTPRVPVEGETIRGIFFSQFTGGKGANQAVAASKLGGEVTILGKIGNDSSGKAHINSLKKYGVDYSYVLREESIGTGIGFITLERNGKNRIVIIPGANEKLSSKDIEENEKLIKECDILILQLEIPLETTYKAIDLAYKYKKTIIFNPAPYIDFKKSYLKKLSYIVLNEVEARECTGIEINNKEKAKEGAESLLELGCKNVIITMGDKGVYFLNVKKEYFIDSRKVDVVDTTGAGDEFIGAFAYCISKNWDIYDAIQFANIASALAVTKMGTQPSFPYFDEVVEYIGENAQELMNLVE